MSEDALALASQSAREFADRTRRQVAVRLLPFLFVLYIANYLDRTSIAYAAIGMARELGFNDRVFGLGAGIFFIGYVALQIPGALLVEHWSARRMISTTLIAWGAMTALTALVRTPTQLYLARFVLGAAEAGFFPGVIVYLSHWFSRRDRAKATSNFMSAIPLSFVIGSPIAGLILGYSFFGIVGWRWLFLLEGIPAMLLGFAAYFYLTDLPRDAKWLASEQRNWLESTLQSEKSGPVQSLSIAQAFGYRPIVLMASVCFLNYMGYYSFLFALPLMLKRMSGFSDLNVGLIGAIPYAALFFALLFNGWHSDKMRERRWHCTIPGLFSALGFFALTFHPSSVPVLILIVTLATIGNSYLPAMWAMPTETLDKSAAAAAVGMINGLGSVAGFLGPYIFGYVNTRAGSFTPGLVMITITTLAASALVLAIPKPERASS